MPFSTNTSLQQRLSEAEESYSKLLNRLPGIAYRCKVTENYGFILDFVSKGSFELLGVRPEEMLQKEHNAIERMMVTEDLERTRAQIYDSIVANESYSVVYRATLANGQTKWIWDQGHGVFDNNGKCLFIEGLMLDTTEQKSQELTLKAENKKLRSTIKSSYAFAGMVGKSDVMQNLYETIVKASASDTNIILYGETGVGKDLAAKTIHDLSRVKGRYVPVNCAAIPEQLLESEFFGHVKGAFSGAISHHVGYLAAANDGTLFLDEIAELPIKLQVKLLRAIESRTFSPVGSTEIKHSKFRLISATNQNLHEMVRSKTLRADFYYRIHVLAINIPPLRDRTGDLPLLIDTYAKDRGITETLPPHVYMEMEKYTWPGNVRELQNVLDRYWAFGESALELNLHGEHHYCAYPPTEPPLPNTASIPVNMQLPKAKEELEKQQIISTLTAHGWKKGETAKALGITIRTLQRKVKKYDITR